MGPREGPPSRHATPGTLVGGGQPPRIAGRLDIGLAGPAQSKLNEGVVLAAGPGRRNADGEMIPMELKVDDKVLLPQYGGNEVTIDDEDLVLFRSDDILGVLKD